MTRDDLIGTWRLKEFRLTGVDGAVSHPWGADIDGILIYAPDGYMAVTVRRPGGTMTYTGEYAVDDGAVVHRISLASEPGLVGTAQRREAERAASRLVLSGRPSLYGGPGTTSHLIWERAAAPSPAASG